jgi:internalin A
VYLLLKTTILKAVIAGLCVACELKTDSENSGGPDLDTDTDVDLDDLRTDAEVCGTAECGTVDDNSGEARPCGTCINSKTCYDNFCVDCVKEYRYPDHTIVQFEDSFIERQVRGITSKLTGTIYYSDVKNIGKIGASEAQISSLMGMEYLTCLTVLNYSFNNIEDISPLNGLTNLRELNLVDNPINNIGNLGGLTNLTKLELTGSFDDISSLSGLTSLRKLTLRGNNIDDISVLSGFTSLTELDLSVNQIVDISSLSGLANLTELYLKINRIVDISSLSGLTNLTKLRLNRNEIVDISSLSGLINLTWLELDDNQIVDISPLVSNAGIDDKTYIDLRNNLLDCTDTATIDNIIALRRRDVPVREDCP